MAAKTKIIFMGTPVFAVPALKSLHLKYGIDACVTTPDKPKGRGRKLQPSPVKTAALELGIPVLQPESLKSPEFESQIKAIDPDIIVVIAFRILPEAVYSKAKIAAFNIHGSLLPKYRGAAPINWAIINGETKTGLTSFILQKKVDTGNMLLKKEINIDDSTTAGDLHDALMPMASDLAMETIELLLKGGCVALPQSDEEATPAPKLFRDGCKIDWQWPAGKLLRFIHGTSPLPGAWTMWDGKILKILRVKLALDINININFDIKSDINIEPGCFEIMNKRMYVECGAGALELVEIQLQGKKAMKMPDFLRGYRGEDSGSLDGPQ